MRLFIAINLDAKMKNALISVKEELIKRGVSGNFTKEENMHLTLAFIGEYGDAKTVLDVMRSVPFEPFTFSLDALGSFGDLWWIGLKSRGDLASYVLNLRKALEAASITFDKKRFLPHITLVRRAGDSALPSITVPDVTVTARCVSLMKSTLTPRGPVYTEIGRADAK